jgi:hypothetical protein
MFWRQQHLNTIIVDLVKYSIASLQYKLASPKMQRSLLRCNLEVSHLAWGGNQWENETTVCTDTRNATGMYTKDLISIERTLNFLARALLGFYEHHAELICDVPQVDRYFGGSINIIVT